MWIIILRRYRNIHLQKIRYREAKRLQAANEKLQREIQDKNAELFTQTSFTIQKNQLDMTIRNLLRVLSWTKRSKESASFLS